MDSNIPLVHAVGMAAAASFVTWYLLTKDSKAQRRPPRENPDLDWLSSLYTDDSKKRVRLSEWDDPSFRKNGGWRGNDLIHHAEGKAVRILAYFWDTELQVR
jgi:hypothetical protein